MVLRENMAVVCYCIFVIYIKLYVKVEKDDVKPGEEDSPDLVRGYEML